MVDPAKVTALQGKIERYYIQEARERYEGNLTEFLQGAWSSIDSAVYQQCWAIDAICDHLEAVTLGHIPRLLINVPPRCSKTTVASICWPAWTWARTEESYWSGPKVKFLCGSYNGVLAMSSANTMRRLLMSPWYQKLWGKKFELTEDQNTKNRFDNTLGGTRQSTSVGGSLLGLGGDIIICLPYSERVLTSRGWLPIGEIVEQQLQVKVAGEHNGSVVWQDIEKYEQNPGRETVRISWGSGSLRCTEDHLVFVEGRGYIKARDICPQDVLWSAEGGVDGAFVLDLQQKCFSLGSTLGAVREKEVYRAFLQQKLPWSVRTRGEEPCLAGRKGYFALQRMWQAFLRQAKIRSQWAAEVLFEWLSLPGIQASQARKEVSAWVSGVRKTVLNTVCILLFASMRKQFAFTAHDREGEQQLHPWTATSNLPQGLEQRIQGFNTRTRQPQLPPLWPYSSLRETSVSGAPYRLRSAQPGPDELDYPLRTLSRRYARGAKVPCGLERKVVCAIERAGYEAVTYNLRVTPGHNYFAEGILVHNCDDPHNTETEKVVETDTDRIKVESWWKELSGTRLNSPKESAIVVVMQRLHERDLSGVILDSDDEDWTHLMIPLEHDTLRHNVTVKLPQYDDDEPWEDPRTEEGELMWPERFGEVEVARIKSRLGVYMAAGRLQQEPVPKGGGIIKRDWWLPWDSTTAQEYGLEWNAGRKEFPHFELVVGSVDTSYGRKEENDYNAMTVWGIWLDKAKNRRAMLMYAWAKRMPLRGRLVDIIPGEAKVNFEARQREAFGLIELIADTCKRYKVRRLLVENKTRGQDVADEIKRLFARENFGVELLEPVGDKTSRTHSIVPLFNDDGIWAPNTKWAEQVITQSASFPKADHDDLHDTVTQFLLWARDRGLLCLAEETSAMETEDAQFRGQIKSVAEAYGV